jgi:[methyl-Co(III) methanol-specific corrinoid protein]:coenzyme M methyltransferase
MWLNNSKKKKEKNKMATNLREGVLKFFKREKIDYVPLFSGMGNITVHGLEKYGWKFPEIHTDGRKMANMAASSFQLFGFPCAVVPFDMGVEAEVLGSKVNYYAHAADILYPTIIEHPAEKVEDLNLQVPSDLAKAGRIPVVTEALRLLKQEVGNQIPIGAWVLGLIHWLGNWWTFLNLPRRLLKRQKWSEMSSTSWLEFLSRSSRSIEKLVRIISRSVRWALALIY